MSPNSRVAESPITFCSSLQLMHTMLLHSCRCSSFNGLKLATDSKLLSNCKRSLPLLLGERNVNDPSKFPYIYTTVELWRLEELVPEQINN
jgi:hypothetical protein